MNGVKYRNSSLCTVLLANVLVFSKDKKTNMSTNLESKTNVIYAKKKLLAYNSKGETNRVAFTLNVECRSDAVLPHSNFFTFLSASIMVLSYLQTQD